MTSPPAETGPPDRQDRRLVLLLTVASAATAFLLAFNRITDTDAWMHLSLGRLIWNTGGLPAKEVFTYPALDFPFSYSSWLFGLICYLAERLHHEAGPVMFKATVIAGAFFFLAKDARTPRPRPLVVSWLIGLALMLSVYRFVLRPDILLLFYLAFSVFSLNAYWYRREKWIYALPALHVLWANTHSSLNLMLVVFGAFVVGGSLQRYLGLRGMPADVVPEKKTLLTLLGVFSLSFLASLASPYGLKQYLFASQYLTGRWFKEEILELQPAHGIVAAAVLLLGAVFLLSVLWNRKRFSLVHFLLPLPFFVMPFMAKRFAFLPAIIACPIIARHLAATLPALPASLRRIPGLRPALVVIPLLLLGLTGRFHPTFEPEATHFGIGYDERFLPRGAADYMAREDLRGRVLNTFSFGQYLIWRFYPDVTVFTDARGYIPEADQEAMGQIQNPAMVDRLYRSYGFRTIVLPFPTPADDGIDAARRQVDVSFRDPDWALVYWDDLSRLYLRRDPGNAPQIERDEYRHIRPDMAIDYLVSHPGNIPAGIDELRRNVRETGSVRGRVLLAILLQQRGRYQEVLAQLAGEDVDEAPTFSTVAKALRGDALQKLGRYPEAVQAYRRVVREKPDASVYYKLGALLIELKQPGAAVDALEAARRKNPELSALYPLLIYAYQQAGNRGKADEARKAYARLGRAGSAAAAGTPAEQHFIAGIKAYKKKSYDVAIREFRASIAADPTHAEVFANLAYVFYDTGRIDEADRHFRRALRLNPQNPEAHYGMGLVQKKKNNVDEARRHFKTYIELEPKGYFSRNAERQIKALEKSSP